MHYNNERKKRKKCDKEEKPKKKKSKNLAKLRGQKNLRRMKFTCLICKRKYDNILALREHMKDHLND